MISDGRVRAAERVWISREPISFRNLCEQAVPPETKLVVFDLDRTLHLDRNMGELLGWEISALHGYGEAYLGEIEPRRGRGRWVLSWRHPLSMLRYLVGAGRIWIGPGLHYLMWGKIASRVLWLRQRAFKRFGPEPVHAVQRRPQDVLFEQIATLPLDVVRVLAERVWARCGPDQTVEREDLEWLRRRCPEARIVLSTASPLVMAEVAQRELGFDDVIASTPGNVNGGRAKLETLRARYVELRTPGVVTVGISDTGYGEDHCWTESFTHVVDVNSHTPFPPIVPVVSPLRAVYSAQVLTRAEHESRARGAPSLDPRRRQVVGVARAFGPKELQDRLASVIARLDRLRASTSVSAPERAYRMTRLHERARKRLDLDRER